ncbi:MAG: hypothetical protein M4579_004785 [Chaenotheca gracillima]|nr:MAG: hypothetical protein M4579_004785 [Chaenotheca gracillima]
MSSGKPQDAAMAAAIEAAMLNDLGQSRRDNLPLQGRKQHLDLSAIDKGRRINQRGTAESRLDPDQKKLASRWKTDVVDGDDEASAQLETDMGFGQSHRLKMVADLKIRPGDQFAGRGRGQPPSLRGVGRGGGVMGSRARGMTGSITPWKYPLPAFPSSKPLARSMAPMMGSHVGGMSLKTVAGKQQASLAKTDQKLGSTASASKDQSVGSPAHAPKGPSRKVHELPRRPLSKEASERIMEIQRHIMGNSSNFDPRNLASPAEFMKNASGVFGAHRTEGAAKSPQPPPTEFGVKGFASRLKSNADKQNSAPSSAQVKATMTKLGPRPVVKLPPAEAIQKLQSVPAEKSGGAKTAKAAGAPATPVPPMSETAGEPFQKGKEVKTTPAENIPVSGPQMGNLLDIEEPREPDTPAGPSEYLADLIGMLNISEEDLETTEHKTKDKGDLLGLDQNLTLFESILASGGHNLSITPTSRWLQDISSLDWVTPSPVRTPEGNRESESESPRVSFFDLLDQTTAAVESEASIGSREDAGDVEQGEGSQRSEPESGEIREDHPELGRPRLSETEPEVSVGQARRGKLFGPALVDYSSSDEDSPPTSPYKTGLSGSKWALPQIPDPNPGPVRAPLLGLLGSIYAAEKPVDANPKPVTSYVKDAPSSTKAMESQSENKEPAAISETSLAGSKWASESAIEVPRIARSRIAKKSSAILISDTSSQRKDRVDEPWKTTENTRPQLPVKAATQAFSLPSPSVMGRTALSPPPGMESDHHTQASKTTSQSGSSSRQTLGVSQASAAPAKTFTGSITKSKWAD